MKLTKEQIDFLYDKNTTIEQRKYACGISFPAFACYYFNNYFKYHFADFHFDFFEDIHNLVHKNTVREAAWIGFAECSKTSVAKMALCWIICYKKRLYPNVDSAEKENAERILFDVVLELQTNPRILNDFGQLYNKKRTDDEVTSKRVANFVTNNGVRVEAHSVHESVRGRIHGLQRPDFFLLDDVENSKTAESIPITQKIIKHIDEIKRGLASIGSSVLYLGNYIIEEGVVGYIMKSVAGSGGKLRFIPIKDKKGNIAWKDKYCDTDIEANEINKTRPADRKIVSLEEKKRTLNAGGRRVYEVEMMLDPVSAGSPFFDRKTIDNLIEKAIPHEEDKAGFYVWDNYNPSHRYGIGADTSMGSGRDHNASVITDFSTIPARQVGSYMNNLIPPDIFAHELKRQGNMYGTCLLAPESNAESGGACVTALRLIYPVDKIFRQRQTGKNVDVADKTTVHLGWRTDVATKPDMLFKLKSAVESGHYVIQDIRILKEMRSYMHSDINQTSTETRHFDLLMATAISWAMKDYAEVKELGQSYQQPVYESPLLDN